ncbi:MAG: hypothetical protein CM15mP9_0360 [Methanobacteriota archaeon]|nr:MAG: hypothetical protein CM15mP9_0360 [Euryarchaeota archaeon]
MERGICVEIILRNLSSISESNLADWESRHDLESKEKFLVNQNGITFGKFENSKQNLEQNILRR